MELQLETRTIGAWMVIDVTGEVDLSTAPSLQERITALATDGHHHILVNLSEVSFMDSSGLGVLVAGLKRLREAGGEMALVCSGGPVLKILTITGLDRVFPMYGSIEEAAPA